MPICQRDELVAAAVCENGFNMMSNTLTGLILLHSDFYILIVLYMKSVYHDKFDVFMLTDLDMFIATHCGATC